MARGVFRGGADKAADTAWTLTLTCMEQDGHSSRRISLRDQTPLGTEVARYNFRR